jgi:hypothetical protein
MPFFCRHSRTAVKRPCAGAPGAVLLVVGVVALAFVLVVVELVEELPHAARTTLANTARTTAANVVRLRLLLVI